MTSQTAPKLIDSSVWLAYYFGESENARRIIESTQPLTLSIMNLYEIERKLFKLKYPETPINEFLGYLQSRATLQEVTLEICRVATRFSIKHNFAAMDSLILATSRSLKTILVTGDKDFKGLDGVEIIT